MAKKSCCNNELGISMKCLLCGFSTCPLHATIWTDNKAHCASCFAPLSELPSKQLFTVSKKSNMVYRCLLIIDGLYIAGAQKSALSLIHTLQEIGVSTHVLSLYGGGQWYDNFLKICDVVSISYNSEIDWSVIESTDGFVQPNIISSHLCEPSVWASIYTPVDIPLIVHLHSEISEHEQLTHVQARLVFSRAQSIIVPSLTTQEFYLKWSLQTLLLDLGMKISIVPNIIHPKLCKTVNHKKRRLTNRATLFAPTRLDRDKLDIDILFSFIDRLKFNKNIILLIAGDGEYKCKLEDVISKKQKCPFIYLLGFESDIEDRYAIADAVILFSKREAMPMVLLEAIFHDLPIVAPNIGVFQSIDSLKGIFLYESGNIDELLTAMEKALLASFSGFPIYSAIEKKKYFDIEHYQSVISNIYTFQGDTS